MSELKLYRDIMCFTQHFDSVDLSGIMITPYGLSAFTSGSTSVIETLIPIEESTGRYYVVMDLKKYDYTIVNSLIWTVQYTDVSPIKNLITRFKINPKILIGSEVETEVVNNIIEVEIY